MLREHIFYYFPTLSLIPNRYNIINKFQPKKKSKILTAAIEKESEELVA